jgi:hypothetical protein
MTAVASASVSAALALQRQMALENAMMAQRTPVVIENTPDGDGDADDAVTITLSPGALLFLEAGAVGVVVDSDIEELLIAELLDTAIAVETAIAAETVTTGVNIIV